MTVTRVPTDDLTNMSCANPFRFRSRSHNRIVLFVRYQNKILPICEKCWERLGESSQEWAKNGVVFLRSRFFESEAMV